MTDGLAKLAFRAERLNTRSSCPDLASSDIDYYITVMGETSYSNTPNTRAICASPRAADALLENNYLLARLANSASEIVTGPLRFDSQYWVRKGKTGTQTERQLALSESLFVGITDVAAIEASAKPFHVGLFTSTGVLGTYGMWRRYFEINEGSMVPPPSFRTWLVEPRLDARVQEIASATQWVDFVLAHPRRDGEILTPDWTAVARQYDAVHMTLRGIAATQGLHFETHQGLVASGYWDVESTMWLRWCFDKVSLVETTGSTTAEG